MYYDAIIFLRSILSDNKQAETGWKGVSQIWKAERLHLGTLKHCKLYKAVFFDTLWHFKMYLGVISGVSYVKSYVTN